MAYPLIEVCFSSRLYALPVNIANLHFAPSASNVMATHNNVPTTSIPYFVKSRRHFKLLRMISYFALSWQQALSYERIISRVCKQCQY